MEKLADIKGFVQIEDVSFYIFLAILAFIVLVLIFVGFKIYDYLKNKGKSKKQIAKENLENLDFKDSKKSAYTISKFAPYLLEDEGQKDMFKKLEKTLIKYKYQKNVPDFSDEDKKVFKTFMDLCNV